MGDIISFKYHKHNKHKCNKSSRDEELKELKIRFVTACQNIKQILEYC